jgi:Carboxypeptidase regulatory-like domain/Domain of unknown function (DUF4214)
MKRVVFRSNRYRFLLSVSVSLIVLAPIVTLAVLARKNGAGFEQRTRVSDPAVETLFVSNAYRLQTSTVFQSVAGRNAPGTKPKPARDAEQPEGALALSLVVNHSDDIAPRGTGVTCITAASSDCTLREAIIKANANAGSNITFAAVTNGVPITLALANSGGVNEDASLTGDLDVTATVTINGNGAANTIIQAGTTNANGIDKVFGLNPICTTSVNVSIDGVTIRNGRNTQPAPSADFSHTGGGLDFCAPAGSASLSITNSNITDNTDVNAYGGGLDIDSSAGWNGTVTLTNDLFQNNKTIGTVFISTGGAINDRGSAQTLNITNCQFINNSTASQVGNGAGINIRQINGGSVNIHNSLFSGNTAGGNGGAIGVDDTDDANGATPVQTLTIDQSTIIKNNISGNVSGGSSGGGGLYINGNVDGLTTISKATFTGNSEGATAGTRLGGGGILVDRGSLTMSFSRIVGNSNNAGSLGGSGLFKSGSDAGTVTATNNWWGCSGGPGTPPCDTAVHGSGGSGTLNFSPFLRIKNTPASGAIIINQSTGLTTRIQDSTGADSAVANLNEFFGINANAGLPLPVTWSVAPVATGQFTASDATLASNGTFVQATATYQALAAGSNTATAKVDNDTTSGNTNSGAITVNKGNATASITGQGLTTTLTGQSFTVNFNAVPSNTTNSPTAMTGNVTVSDGVDSCSGLVNGSGNGSCSLALSTIGSRNITATYVGDSNFNASAASPSLAHSVTNIATWTGTTSSDWNTGTNWATGAVPGSIHDANIPAGALANEPIIVAISVTIINLTVGSGHTLTVNSGASLTATGTSTVNGSFAGSGGSFNFANLTISNASGVTLGGNTTVTGVLALTSGDLNLGANTLTQPNTSTSMGGFDVIGSVKRTGFTSVPNTLSFGNPNNQLTFTAGTLPTDITINLVKSPPAGFSAAVLRTYTITPNPSNLSGFTAKLRLHYLDSELNGNTPESSLNLRRFNGTGWAPYSATTPVDTTNNWVENNAVHNFSQWTFSTLSPTATNGVVSGRITTSDGKPVEGAVVNLSGSQARKTITDANGNYRFDNVDTGGFYTISPSRANYNFNPFNRSFSQIGNQTEAPFAANSMGDNANPIDAAEYFVRQQYLDVLGREPDEAGFNYWSDQILACVGDVGCTRAQRNAVATAFFIEQEAQQTGSYIYDVYAGALGRPPRFGEYAVDRAQVVGGSTLDTAKTIFARSFVQRAEFTEKYQYATTAETFVNALLESVQSSGENLSGERENLIDLYNQNAELVGSRAAVIRSLADNPMFKQSQYNRAFVLTEYFAYLRRDKDPGGYDFWVSVLNTGDPGNYRGMVCSFITSTEYQHHFSRIVTHSNDECAQ